MAHLQGKLTTNMIKSYSNIYDYLKSIVLEDLKTKTNLNNNDKVVTKENKKKLDTINYSKSSTFFTQAFEESLCEILPKPDEFLAKSKSEQKKIQHELDLLSKNEFEWKLYGRKIIRAERCHETLKYFKKEFEIFYIDMAKYIYPTADELSKTQRNYTNFFPHKMQTLIMHFSRTLKNKLFTTIVNKLTEEDYKTLISNYISIEIIFHDLIRLTIQKAHEQLFDSRTPQLIKDNFLTSTSDDLPLLVKKTTIFYEYRMTLASNIIFSVLAFGVDQKYAEKVSVTELEVVFDAIQNLLIHSPQNYQTQLKNSLINPWNIHSDNVQNILQYFENINFFKVEKAKKSLESSTKTEIFYLLPPSLRTLAFRPLNLPRIVQPSEELNIDLLLKPVAHGFGNFTRSEDFKKVLQYSRTKKYRISDTFLTLTSDLLDINNTTWINRWAEMNSIDIPFLTNRSLEKLKDQVSLYEKTEKTTPLALHLHRTVKNSILEKEFRINCAPLEIFLLTGSSQIHLTNYILLDKEKENYISSILKLKFYRTRNAIATLFRGYPLYITDVFDIRLRLYPREHWISRTASSFKHLLSEYTPITLTLKGLINLLRAYYTPSRELSTEFEFFLKKPKRRKELYTFFHEHMLILEKTKETLYFLNLHMEILKSEITGKTSVMLEIDQTASGIVFLALVTRDKQLATKANLIEPNLYNPYQWAMDNVSDFLKSSLADFSDVQVIEFITTNRKMHKYSLMCYSYNQTSFGRAEMYSEMWYNQFKVNPSFEQKSMLTAFACNYDDYINTLFPRLKTKLDILSKMLELVVKETNEVSIKTLDGEKLRWSFYRTKSKTRHRYDPVNNTSHSYRYKVSTANSEGSFEVDLSAHQIRFLPYLIHSIDAAVLRIFIKKMAEKHEYKINHLHDCVILHPNYVDAFYEEVRELYLSDSMYEIPEKLIFEPLKNSLSDGSKEKLEELEKEYLEHTDDFRNSRDFNPKFLYKFEGSSE